MKPNDNKNTTKNADFLNSSQQAAAKIIKSKIDQIYDNDISENNEDTLDPYGWTHPKETTIQDKQLKKYHTAWQDYYKKYYEGYYSHQVPKNTEGDGDYFANERQSTDESQDIGVTQEEAIADLRHKLLNQVSESAQKVKKSRHFKPILSGLIVTLLFLFIQYNGFIIGNIIAYVSPGSIDIQNVVIDPDAQLVVDPAPRLIIPKINVDVPVVYDIGNDYDSLKVAMRQGVAHFAIPGANSHPGEIGNTVLSGHSSNDLFSTGDYKFIFAQLEKLAIGDSIYANYQSKRYTYTVSDIKIVGPTDVASLLLPDTKPVLTLITCTPVGTATSRLLVFADQISPDPVKTSTQPVTSNTVDTTDLMPGKQPTLIEWIFGRRG